MNSQQEVILLQLLNALKTNQEETLNEVRASMNALLELLGGVVRSLQTIEGLVMKVRVQQEEMTAMEP